MHIVNSKNAYFFMFLLTCIWGSSYVFLKVITDNTHPLWGYFLNSAFSLFIFLLVFGRRLRGLQKQSLKTLCALSFFSVVSNISNIIGISGTTSTNAAFIIQLSIVFVPVIMSVRRRSRPHKSVVVCCVLAMAGLAILTLDFRDFNVNKGDLFVVVAALAFAGYLVVLTEKSAGLRQQDIILAVYSFAFVSSLITLVAGRGLIPMTTAQFTNLPFMVSWICGCSLMFIAMTLQISVSRFLSAEVMSISYCFEPVATATLAFFVLGERLKPYAWFGMALILLALLYLTWASLRLA